MTEVLAGDLSHYAFWLIAISCAGLFGGFLAGLLGMGGGIIIVPVLYQVFTAMGVEENLRMKIAVATSLATLIATAGASVRTHYKQGTVDVALLKSWGGAICIGIIIGALISSYINGRVLSLTFSIVALAIALQMALNAKGAKLWDGFPNAISKYASGVIIGLVSVLMGIGGGSLTIPILSLVGYDIRKSVGTASAIGFIIAIPGTLSYIMMGLHVAGLPPFSFGYLNWLGALMLAPLTMSAAPYGARLAHKIPRRALQICFSVLLGLTAAKMLYDLGWSHFLKNSLRSIWFT